MRPAPFFSTPSAMEHSAVQPPVGEALGLFAFSLFLNIFKDWFSFYLCDFICVCAHVCSGVCRGDKRVLDPLKLLLASRHGCWEPNPRSLEEQQVLLTDESSVQPLFGFHSA